MFEMSKEALDARRKYKREWARKNREKRMEYEARYWQRKADEMRTAAEELKAANEG